MQRNTRGTTNLRTSWRLQQATKDAFASAADQPTLEARPLLLQGRLAPLFATHTAELSKDAFTWNETDCKTDAAALSNSASPSTGSYSMQKDVPTRVTGQKLRSSIVAHLKSLESLDGWTELNRALLHNFLFAAWQATRGVVLSSAPFDDLAVDSTWRLSTGRAASSISLSDI